MIRLFGANDQLVAAHFHHDDSIKVDITLTTGHAIDVHDNMENSQSLVETMLIK